MELLVANQHKEVLLRPVPYGNWPRVAISLAPPRVIDPTSPCALTTGLFDPIGGKDYHEGCEEEAVVCPGCHD